MKFIPYDDKTKVSFGKDWEMKPYGLGANVKDSTIQFTFAGTYVFVSNSFGKENCKKSVTIDGKNPVEVNTYKPSNSIKQVLFKSIILEDKLVVIHCLYYFHNNGFVMYEFLRHISQC